MDERIRKRNKDGGGGIKRQERKMEKPVTRIVEG